MNKLIEMKAQAFEIRRNIEHLTNIYNQLANEIAKLELEEQNKNDKDVEVSESVTG